MRDRTKSRRYSPEAERFRQEHARHRDWGLQQRHAIKLWRLRRERAAAAAQRTTEPGRPGYSPRARAEQPTHAEQVTGSTAQPPAPASRQTADPTMNRPPRPASARTGHPTTKQPPNP